MKKSLAIILVLSGCTSHDVTPADSGDYIIFGHFYGECIGEKCVEIFKLTSNALYEDTNDQYPSQSERYKGRYRLLDTSLFNQVRDLRDAVPSALNTIDDRVIGMPDAGDWGGIYFEQVVDGTARYWFIDKNEMYLPEELVPFVELIEDKISLINQ